MGFGKSPINLAINFWSWNKEMLKTQAENDKIEKNHTHNGLMVEIAGFGCLIESDHEIFIHKLRDIYAGFLSYRQPDLTLEIGFDSPKTPRFYGSEFKTASLGNITISTRNLKAYVDLVNGIGTVNMEMEATDEVLFNFGVFLASLCSIYLAENRGLLLHALGVVDEDDRGYVFFGPSGSGKTTIGKLSGQNQVLNDERLAVKVYGEKALMFNTPFWSQKQLINNHKSFDIKGVFLLKKANRCEAKQVKGPHAVVHFMNELYSDPFSQLLGGHLQLRSAFELEKVLRPRNHQLSKAIFNNFCELALRVPCYNLYFSKDEEALWRCLNELP